MSVRNRADSMKHKLTRQIKCRSDFCLSCRLFMPLLFYNRIAGGTKPDSSKGVYAVVDTVVARLPAACHSAVCCIYNCVNFECSDVASPNVKIITSRNQIRDVGNSAQFNFFLQILIFNMQKLFTCRNCMTHIHK